MKKHILISLLISFSLFLNAQIINKGTLKIKDGTTVYFGEVFTNNASATLSNEGNLHLNSDFINNGTITASTNADAANGITYFDSPTNTNAIINDIQHISGTNKVIFENLEINMTGANAKGVLVADNMELIVENSVNLVNKDLRLENKAQLIQLHTGTNANSGNNNLLRDQQGTTDVYNYNYWSSPVSGVTTNQFQVGEVLYDGTDASINPFDPKLITYSTGSPWNGSPAIIDGSGNVTTASNLESYWIWKFENQDIDDLNGWELLRNNTSINAGIGFTHKGNGASSSNQNYVFKGKPNDGSYTFTLGTNKSTLLGNPYPSAMDANKFINDNAAVLADVTTPSNTTGALYFWEHWGGNSHFQSDYQGGYATYTLAGGTPPTSHPLVNGGGTSSGINGQQYIPVAQGFFVESNSGGTITIDNSQRVFKTEGTDSHFFRNENSNITDSTQRIRLGYHNPDGFFRQIMTAFIPETHDRHDTGYDARMPDVNLDDFFWETNNDAYVIDARPFGIDKQIPIGIKVSTTGTHEIFLFEAENFSNPIYILDTNTGYTTDIRQQNFEVQLEAGIYLDRFKLVFLPQSPLSINDVIKANLNVFFTPNSHQIIIENFNKLQIKNITIFNAIGQKIKIITKDKIKDRIIQIPFYATNGTYLVSIQTDTTESGYKIIVY